MHVIIKQMKVFSAILLAISILGVSVFGFLGMQAMHDEANGGCLANFAGGATPCPLRDGMFAFSLFHSSVFKNSVASAFAPVSLFLFSLLLAFLFVIALGEGLSFFKKQPLHSRADFGVATPVRMREASWIALHEHSPSMLRSA